MVSPDVKKFSSKPGKEEKLADIFYEDGMLVVNWTHTAINQYTFLTCFIDTQQWIRQPS